MGHKLQEEQPPGELGDRLEAGEPLGRFTLLDADAPLLRTGLGHLALDLRTYSANFA